MQSRPTDNLEAYDYYLKAIEYLGRPGVRLENFQNARRMLEQAVEWPEKQPAEAVVTEISSVQGPAETPEPQLGTKRGIETMFRSAYRVQMELTALADNKANMMISINAIIISVIIAAVAPKLDSNLWMLFPTIVILVGTLSSVVFAILAARPRLFSEHVELSDLRHSKGNILFFGNFSRISPQQFEEGMEEVMGDRTLTYRIMIRNIYDLGSVLNRKYALLQVAYSVFMVALVLGVLSFIGMFVWILQTIG